ncbi:MAG: DUF1289 domain-containing protein [Rhodoblastus sp.]|nr:DUF1289 domain-containing protein [Rhodoblastus sp.]
MSAVIRPRATQSPCNGVCRMDDTSGLCMGCGRTLSEIGDWGSMSDEQRARVRDLLPERMARLRHERSDSPENGR